MKKIISIQVEYPNLPTAALRDAISRLVSEELDIAVDETWDGEDYRPKDVVDAPADWAVDSLKRASR